MPRAAFAAGDYAKAADAYQGVVRRRADDWIKRRSTGRLVEAAGRSGRFAAAVTGYVQLAQLDPEAAVGKAPQPTPTTPPDQLQAAAREVQQAVEGRGLSTATEKTLLTFLLDLQQRSGDDAAAARTVARLGELVGTGAAGNDDPRLIAQFALARARLALSNNDTAGATKAVGDARASFVEPAQQSEALMILADAARRDAGTDPQKLLDAALAYMKVVAHFKNAPRSPERPRRPAGDRRDPRATGTNRGRPRALPRGRHRRPRQPRRRVGASQARSPGRLTEHRSPLRTVPLRLFAVARSARSAPRLPETGTSCHGEEPERGASRSSPFPRRDTSPRVNEANAP